MMEAYSSTEKCPKTTDLVRSRSTTVTIPTSKPYLRTVVMTNYQEYKNMGRNKNRFEKGMILSTVTGE